MCSGLTAFSALKRIAEHAKRGPVLLVGLGGVGMMGLAFALALFPHAPIVADIDAAKREAALKAGAAAAYDPADPDGPQGAAEGDRRRVRRGRFRRLRRLARALRPARSAKGGKVVITGLIGGTYTTPIAMFPLRAMTIEGTMTGTLAEAEEMMALARAGKDPAGADHRAPALRRAGLARRSARRQDRRPRRAGAVASADLPQIGRAASATKPSMSARCARSCAVRGQDRAQPREALVEIVD